MKAVRHIAFKDEPSNHHQKHRKAHNDSSYKKLPEFDLTSAVIGGVITAAGGLVGAMTNAWWNRRQQGIYDFQKSLANVWSEIAIGGIDCHNIHRRTLRDVAAAVYAVRLFLFEWERPRLMDQWNEYKNLEQGNELSGGNIQDGDTIDEWIDRGPVAFEAHIHLMIESTKFRPWPYTG